MNIDAIQQKLMQSVHVGLALVSTTGLKTFFVNENFKNWFQGDPDSPLGLLAEHQEFKDTISSLTPGDQVKLEISAKQRRRVLSLSIHVSRLESAETDMLLIEAQNNTRIKELESMIDSYSKMVERNERELKREKERAEKLLLNIMPKSVLEELQEFGVTAPQSYEAASVLILDFVSFTDMSITDDPAATVSELNDIFTNFDRIVEQFGCERIKTIGDAYMAVSGLPEPSADHAQSIAKVAQLFIRYLERRNTAHETQWLARIGIATGPVIGSIVGVHKYVYDIFGPAVNLASRMERQCRPMEIILCHPLAEMIQDQFDLTSMGIESIKGFGEQELFTLGRAIST